MGRVFQGDLVGSGRRIGIVVSRFNEFITRQLLEGARDCLLRHGVDDGAIDVAWVPGAMEISLIAKRMAATGLYDAVICLGAVIRGATPHFEYVSSSVAGGVASASLDTGVPIVFGVLTTDTIEQAVERAGTKAGNKGYDAALAALEMASLVEAIQRARPTA